MHKEGAKVAKRVVKHISHESFIYLYIVWEKFMEGVGGFQVSSFRLWA